MSKWIVDIHGDIEGDYEIIEEYKEPTTEDDILKAIIDDCNNHSRCKGCKYLNIDSLRCKFRDIPKTWEVE